MALVDLDMRHFRAHGGVFKLLHFYRHSNVMRVRPYLTKPAHAAGHNEHRTQDAYAHVCDQTREGERQAQGQYQRPRRLGRQFHDLLSDIRCFVMVIHSQCALPLRLPLSLSGL